MTDKNGQSTKIFKSVLDELAESAVSFKQTIEKRFPDADKDVLQGALQEYLTFLMYCATSMFQENDLVNSDLDEFYRKFYERMLKSKLLKAGVLLDYEKASRERYLDFYRILSEGHKEEQLTGKRLNSLIAKETLFLEKLLPVTGKDILSEIYSDLFAKYNDLTLKIQLLFYSKNKL